MPGGRLNGTSLYVCTEKAVFLCVSKNLQIHARGIGRQQRGSVMRRSGSLGTESSAPHTLFCPGRNEYSRSTTGSVHSKLAFNLEECDVVVTSKPLRTPNFLSHTGRSCNAARIIRPHLIRPAAKTSRDLQVLEAPQAFGENYIHKRAHDSVLL